MQIRTTKCLNLQTIAAMSGMYFRCRYEVATAFSLICSSDLVLLYFIGFLSSDLLCTEINLFRSIVFDL
jgi:hypothetical protein